MDFQQKGKEVYRDMEQWTEIRQRVLREGVSKRQIMRETGMHWETLKKILEHSSPPGYKRNKLPKKPKIGPYIGLAEYDLNSVFTMRYMSLIVL